MVEEGCGFQSSDTKDRLLSAGCDTVAGSLANIFRSVDQPCDRSRTDLHQ